MACLCKSNGCLLRYCLTYLSYQICYIISCLQSHHDVLKPQAEHHEIGHEPAAARCTGANASSIQQLLIFCCKHTLLQLILTGKIGMETSDVYAAIMASGSSVTRHHPDLARGGNSEYVQDFDTNRLRSLKFHNVVSSAASGSASSSAAPSSAESQGMRTISHIVYVDPLSPPGRLLLIESFKVRAAQSFDFHFPL